MPVQLWNAAGVLKGMSNCWTCPPGTTAWRQVENIWAWDDVSKRWRLVWDNKASKPVNDAFEVTQDSEVIISKVKLLENDISDLPIVSIQAFGAYGGTLTEQATSFTFKPNVKCNQPAGFKYKITNDRGKQSATAATVTIKVNMLPEIYGYIFDTAELEAFSISYRPPTFKEIFDSWARVDTNLYYPKGTTPTGNATLWEMIGSDQFRCTANYQNFLGFIAPEDFLKYELAATVSSTDSDDDTIGLIIAYSRIGSSNYTLLAFRQQAGVRGIGKKFGIMFIKDASFTLIKGSDGVCQTQSISSWSGAYTRLKVVRNEDDITVATSLFNSTDLATGEVLQINLADYPQLDWARNKLPYGYGCDSQCYSSFTNTTFSGVGATDSTTEYNATTGDCYSYNGTKWVPNGLKIWDKLGYPRIIKNPINNKVYSIEYGSVTLISG